VIDQLRDQGPITQLCALFGCPRSTDYYRAPRRDEQAVLEAIEQVLMHQPWFGYRRVVAQLKRDGWAVGERVVRRLLKSLPHTRSVGRVRVQTTDSHHPYIRYANLIRGLRVTRPNQVWGADITYIRLGSRCIYLAVILDAYSRAVKGWSLSRSLSQELTLDALRMALATGKPAIFHSDQGSQYSAWLHTALLLQAKVRISMSDQGKPMQNGIAERFMRTLKEEHVEYTDYADFDDTLRQIAHWLSIVYNTQRIHSALRYATPAEAEAAHPGRQSLSLVQFLSNDLTALQFSAPFPLVTSPPRNRQLASHQQDFQIFFSRIVVQATHSSKVEKSCNSTNLTLTYRFPLANQFANYIRRSRYVRLPVKLDEVFPTNHTRCSIGGMLTHWQGLSWGYRASPARVIDHFHATRYSRSLAYHQRDDVVVTRVRQ
jgi:putative transposase